MKKKTLGKQEEGRVVNAYKRGDHYLVDHVVGRKLSRVKYGSFVLDYYPDHNTRYAHIPPDEQWKYPDEVRNSVWGPYERRKTKDEILVAGGVETDRGFVKQAQMDYTDFLLCANDVPIDEVWRSIHWIH